jgi:predicted small metal-binding protein
MRVIECDTCGETLSAEDDEQLVRRLGEHLVSEHERELDEHELIRTVEIEAYDATDS